jgi:hypothetical protein
MYYVLQVAKLLRKIFDCEKWRKVNIKQGKPHIPPHKASPPLHRRCTTPSPPRPPVRVQTKTMHTRRSSAPPMRVQIAQINHSLYLPRPPPQNDDTMSITTIHMDKEREHEPSEQMEEDAQYDAEEEEDRPDDFNPRLWQLFNRIQRRGTEPLFPAGWQVDLLKFPRM